MSNTLKTTALLAALTALLVLIGGFFGGQGGMLLFFGFAVVINLGAYWWSGDIALRMAGAHEVTPEQAPELHQLVQELASYARLPKPRVAIIDNPSPNAFATGRDANHAVVAVTTGILGILNRDELAGVLGHELGHVRNHDILISSIAATVAGAITMLAHAAQWAAIFGGGRRSDEEGEGGGGLIGLLLMAVLAPFAAMLIQMAISRGREYEADASGARLCHRASGLEHALAKLDVASRQEPLQATPATAHLFIVNPLTSGGLATLFSTHPPIEERIARLRAMRL